MEVLRYALSVRASTGMPPSHQLAFIRNCSAALAPSIGEQLEEALPGAPLIASDFASDGVGWRLSPSDCLPHQVRSC